MSLIQPTSMIITEYSKQKNEKKLITHSHRIITMY